MNTKKKSCHVWSVLTGVVLVLGLAGTSSAAVVSTDLNSGGTDTGFSGGWDGSSNRMLLTQPDLYYANYSILQGGATQRVYGGNNTHPDRQDSRDVATALSGDIWFTVLVNVPNDGGFAGLAFHSDTLAVQSWDYSHNQADLRIMMSPTELWVDWTSQAVNTAWTPDATVGGFTAGDTHLLLGNLNLITGVDSLDVWVDPDLTVPWTDPTPDYSNTTIDFSDSIARIGVPINTPNDTADAIFISDDPNAFLLVTKTIPEPSSALLFLFGAGIALKAWRRRR